MKLKTIAHVFIFAFGFVAVSQAAVPIMPQDDAQTIERINTYNKQQTEAARSSFRNRVLGTKDDDEEEHEDNMTPKPTRSAHKKMKQEEIEDRKEEREQKVASRAATKDERQADRCEQIEAKINNRINRYEENADKHTARLNAISEKLSSMIEVLEGKGCDVSQLSTLVASLDAKIAELNSLYRTFISELQGTRSLVCGESNGEFVAMVKNSNTKLTEFRRLAQAVSKFVTNEVKPTFKAVAATCVDKEIEE